MIDPPGIVMGMSSCGLHDKRPPPDSWKGRVWSGAVGGVAAFRYGDELPHGELEVAREIEVTNGCWRAATILNLCAKGLGEVEKGDWCSR